jgi:hypothetical protein
MISLMPNSTPIDNGHLNNNTGLAPNLLLFTSVDINFAVSQSYCLS